MNSTARTASPMTLPNRMWWLGGGAVTSLIFIAVMHVVLPDLAAEILTDRGAFYYPFSAQNFMWLAFFVGLAEIWVRARVGQLDARQLQCGYLPEDERTVLQPADLPPIYGLTRESPYAEICFLPRLIQRAIMQFQTSRSVDQTSSILNSNLDLYIHEIDLRYTLLRYIMWLIPSLGFIGTVVGLLLALTFAGDPTQLDNPLLLPEVTKRLAVAFNTTLVALLMASILVYLSGWCQAREEHALNQAGQYCLDNLINRLYVN